MITVKRKNFAGKLVSMDLPVTEEQLKRWANGELIQNVMPHLNPDQREFLISGTIPGEWDKIFPADEE